MNQALLLVDIQNDYFPGGAMELEGSPAAASRAALLLQTFRRRALPVIHVQHVSLHPGATFFLPNTRGVEIHPSLTPADGETLIQKHFPSSFRQTPLLDDLRERQITRLVIAGMMTHMCIDTTVRAAADLGFECRLAHDACATRALTFGSVTVPAAHVHAAFLAALGAFFAKVSSAEEIAAGL